MCEKNEHSSSVHFLESQDEKHRCWYCQIKERASIGYIFNPLSCGNTYNFCKECLIEILVSKVRDFEVYLLTTILKCSKKDLDHLNTLVERFKKLLPKKASKFFQEDLDFTLENLYGKRNQVNSLIYYMLCHIIENKYGEYFNEEDVWTDELIEHINSFTSPEFSFKTPFFEEFEISSDMQEELINRMNKFLKY